MKKSETKMENNGFLTTLFTAGAAIGAAGILYLLFKNRNEEKETETEKPLFTWEEKETLTMAEVSAFYKGIYQEVIKETPKVKPIVLKLSKENMAQYPNFKLEEKEEYPYNIVLTFFNEEKEEIIEKHTKAIRVKALDSNLEDSFRDKDMLVLS